VVAWYLWQLVVVAALVVLYTGAVLLIGRRLGAGVWLAVGVSVWWSYDPGISASMAGINVHPLDGVVAVLVGVMTLRLVSGRIRLALPLWLVAALSAVVVVRGVDLFGLQQGANAARSLVYLVVVMMFAAMLGRSAWPTLRRVLPVVGVVVAAVGSIRLAQHGLGSYAAGGERALNAPQALIVAQASVVYLASPERRRDVWLAAGMLAVVFASQQRTVWATTVVMIAVVVFRAGHLGNRSSTRIIRLAAAAGVLGVVGLLMFGPAELQTSTSTAIDTASTTSGTFGWRIDGWIALLEQYGDKPSQDQLIGQPSGTGYARQIGAGVVEVSPHNMYLTLLLSVGAVGLFMFGWLLLIAMRQSRDVVPLMALLVGLLVFGIGYQWTAQDGAVLGAALGLAHARALPAPEHSVSLQRGSR
jgi:hypothetical protein